MQIFLGLLNRKKLKAQRRDKYTNIFGTPEQEEIKRRMRGYNTVTCGTLMRELRNKNKTVD